MLDQSQLMADLPEDDELAFAVYFQRVDQMADDSQLNGVKRNRVVVTLMKTFAENFHIELKTLQSMPDIEGPDQFFEDWFKQFSNEVIEKSISAQQRQYRPVRATQDHLIQFLPERKHEIRELLNMIRAAVDEIEWTDRKRAFVHSRISALHEAVESEWTPIEKYSLNLIDLSETISEVSGNIGDAAKKLDPVGKWIDRLIKLLGKQRAEDRQDALPAPEEQRRLPAPDGEDEDC